MIRRSEGEELEPVARPDRSRLSIGLSALVVVAFVIAAHREGPIDPTASPSAVATHSDLAQSVDAVALPDDTARFLPTTTEARPGSPRVAEERPTTNAATSVPPPEVTPTTPLVEATSTTAAPSVTVPVPAEAPASAVTVSLPETTTPALPPPADPDVVSHPIPEEVDVLPPAPAPWWAASTTTTGAGYVSTDVGCASGTSAGALDAFFRDRIGPILGHDYQHVYSLGGNRALWLFQDTFVDHAGTGTRLDQGTFVHNSALVQNGACFTLLHRGTTAAPASFEPGNGERRLAKWFWPMGGELSNGQLFVFWVEMEKEGYEPGPHDGLGWHPKRTWLAVYDPSTLARLSFQPAPDAGVSPIYGYAVASDGDYTYLFGNSFEQNLAREGGFGNGPHSGTEMYLARVPRGRFGGALEYRAGEEWTTDPGSAQPILQRYWAENPMQPRFMAGQWVAATKVDGYWGNRLAIDVANHPWGPWTTVSMRSISPRNGDPLMNTYQAHLLPWLDGGNLIVSVSQNGRNMLRDAWPSPQRYRLQFFDAVLVVPPAEDVAVDDTTTSTTVVETTTTTAVPDNAPTVAATTTSDASTSEATTTTTTEPTTTSEATTTTASDATTTGEPTTTTTTTTTPTPTTTPTATPTTTTTPTATSTATPTSTTTTTTTTTPTATATATATPTTTTTATPTTTTSAAPSPPTSTTTTGVRSP